MIGEFLREAVQVKAAYTADVLAEIVTTAKTGAAGTTDQRRVRHDTIARHEVRNAFANRNHLACRLRADRQWEPPLRECHAPKAPEVNVIQSDTADAELHLAGWRWWWRVTFLQREGAVSEQLQSADHGHGKAVADCACGREGRQVGKRGGLTHSRLAAVQLVPILTCLAATR